MERQAFVLRMFLGGIYRLPEALECNQIMIGWAHVEGLLDPSLSWEEFRNTVSPNEENRYRVGWAGGTMWRFVREMNIDDLVVVPYGSNFYVARIAGPVTYDKSKEEEDTSYRRCVEWLNDGRPIPRLYARSALIAKMGTQHICLNASNLMSQIEECLSIAEAGKKPSFQVDLQQKLVKETLAEIRSGRMDAYGFEYLVRDVLRGLGAHETKVIPRNQDKGADIIATFGLAEAFSLTLAVQAKYFRPDPPVQRNVVEQLVAGMRHHGADMGMVVTSGSISPEAEEYAEEISKDEGTRIELVDGEQLAGIIVEHGLSVMKES